MKNNNGLMLSWIKYHGRSSSLAAVLGIPEVNIYPNVRFTLARYFISFLKTVERIFRTKPDFVVVMQPPIFALLSVLFARTFYRFEIVGDLHTGAFDNPKWTWSLPIVRKILKRFGFALVTNDSLAHELIEAGVDAIVCHDPLSQTTTSAPSPIDNSFNKLRKHEYVLLPLTYAYDEPLEELIAAAYLTPETTWVFTGSAPKGLISSAPDNVFFSGFVTKDEYNFLLENAGVVIAPTTAENTMQRAGYEALCSEVPLITTSTRVLVEYFGEAAIASRCSGKDFSDSVKKLFQNREDYQIKMRELLQEKLEEQRIAMNNIYSRLGLSVDWEGTD